jgi:hypothetical protein
MRRSISSFLVAALIALLGFCSEEFLLVTRARALEMVTLGDLLKQCQEIAGVIQDDNVQLQNANTGKCWGYLSAYLDISTTTNVDVRRAEGAGLDRECEDRTHRSVNNLLVNVCLPKGLSRVQVMRMLIDYAIETSRMKEQAHIALTNMLMRKFQCKQER